MKLLEETIGSKPSDIALSNIFFSNLSTQRRETKEKINQWDYIKLKSYCTAKEIINKMKRQPNELERIFSKDKFNKRLRYRENPWVLLTDCKLVQPPWETV